MLKLPGWFLILTLSMLLAPVYLSAQMDSEPRNLPKYDKSKIHFGFTLGINTTTFVIHRADELKIRDTIYSVEAESVSGINLGILSNVRIAENFDFRFIPTLSFAQRNLNYHFIFKDSAEANTLKQIESTYLQFPFDLKFKSNRRNNYRFYVLAGFMYSIDMISQAKVKDKDKTVVKLKRKDYAYEIGLGVDFYLPYFKFAPEIKMVNGLSNLLIQEDTQFTRPLNGLQAKTFMISFTFE